MRRIPKIVAVVLALGGNYVLADWSEKYGIADRWVRFVGADTEFTRAVRLERIDDAP